MLKVISRSAFDLQKVLDTLVESATRLCDADFSLLFMREGEEFRWSTSFGQTADVHERVESYFKSRRISIDRGSITGRAALEAHVIHVSDVLADPDYTWSEAQRISGYRAAIGVPLFREQTVIGVIFVGKGMPQPFTPDQIGLVTTFADQAVIAIENARLFDEVQARTEELSELLQQQTATADVLKVISRSAFDLQAVLDTLAESAARLCEADIVAIWRPAETGYRLAATYHASYEQRDYMEGVAHQPGRGSLVGRALLEASVVHIHDTLEDPEYLMDVSKLREFRTQLGVPFLREDVPIGVIALIRRAVRPFTEKQIELVTTFADQAVIAIENVAAVRGGAGAHARADRIARVPNGNKRRAERDQQIAIRFEAGVRRDCANYGAALSCADSATSSGSMGNLSISRRRMDFHRSERCHGA